MNRKEILYQYNKNEFADFLKEDNNGRILKVLNEEGLYLLKNHPLKEEKIVYILTFSNYKDELFKNSSFLDIFLESDISCYYATLVYLKDSTYDMILKRGTQILSDKQIATLFIYFREEYKQKVIENWPYKMSILYEIVINDNPKIIDKIIRTYPIDLTHPSIDLYIFFEKAKRSVLESQEDRYLKNDTFMGISIPSSMLTKEVIEKIWQNYDVIAMRTLLNNALYCTDGSFLKEEIKKKEEELILHWDESKKKIPAHKLAVLFYSWKNESDALSDISNEMRKEYLILLKEYQPIIKKLETLEYKSIEEIENYIEEENNKLLSNYIIDYLFEEIYYNIMIDIRELLDFYYRGNIVIPENRIEIYQQLSNIDWYSKEEKINFFHTLKKEDWVTTLYDDMAYARKIVRESIKECALSSKTIKEYKDEELSKKYHVDVYKMNGQAFFGIVKSGNHLKEQLPVGHSFSLIGEDGIAVFGEGKNMNTFLYDSDDLNPDQIVHIFPFDSFSFYRPFHYSEVGTRSINHLLTVDELVKNSQFYNELLILERGTKKIGIESSLPELKRIALYCIDRITEEDVKIAQENNVGILLIPSWKYQQSKNNSIQNIDYWHGHYYNESEKETFEKKH